jgi:ribosomal protein L31E
MIAIQRIRTALTRKIQKAKARQIPTKITIRVIKERSSGGSLKGIIKPALQLQ